MQKRARVIYNPTAGRELMKQKMIDILGIFEEAGGTKLVLLQRRQKKILLKMKLSVQPKPDLIWSWRLAVTELLTKWLMELRR